MRYYFKNSKKALLNKALISRQVNLNLINKSLLVFNFKKNTLILLLFTNMYVHSSNVIKVKKIEKLVNHSLAESNLEPILTKPKFLEKDIITSKTVQYNLLSLLPISFLFLLYKNKKKYQPNIPDCERVKDLEELLIEEKEFNSTLSLKINDKILLLAENEKTLFSKELQISTFHDSISKISEDISKLINTDSEINASKLFSIEKTLLMMLNNEDVWEDFKYQFEKTRPHFYKKLLAVNPNLTVSDLKQCSYVIARLSSKEVSNLVNISYRSIETSRYRLKKKLNLEPNTKLYHFLQNL